ncbi:MAG: relaxase/mobilization nuclease domain-containing protein [Methylotenera sp.]
MISKLNGGAESHSAQLTYSMTKEGAVEIAAVNVYSTDANSRAAEMSAVSSSNSKLTKPGFHASLSLPAGERGTDEQWRAASEAYLTSMGFDIEKTQYVVTRHQDTDKDHIHIVANRVQLDGKTVSMSNDRRRSHAACRVAEKESGLHAYDAQEPKAQKGRLHDLRTKVDSALSDKPTIKQFKERLQKEGVDLKLNRSQSTGHVSGISYADDSGRQFKGSALGKQYSLKGLQDRGLHIEDNSAQKPQNQQGRGVSSSAKSMAHTMKNPLAVITKNPAAALLKNPLSLSNVTKIATKAINKGLEL